MPFEKFCANTSTNNNGAVAANANANANVATHHEHNETGSTRQVSKSMRAGGGSSDSHAAAAAATAVNDSSSDAIQSRRTKKVNVVKHSLKPIIMSAANSHKRVPAVKILNNNANVSRGDSLILNWEILK